MTLTESGAAVLRRAAVLMRERAEMATPGPWREGGADNRYRALVSDTPHPDRTKGGGWEWDDTYGGCLIGESLMGADRRHIASWHPLVALAIADWLDDEAGWVESDEQYIIEGALAVAYAYLGECVRTGGRRE